MNREERERESTSEEGKRHERDLDTATTLWRRKSLAASCSELWAGAAAAGCAGARGGGGGAVELLGFDFFLSNFFLQIFSTANFFSLEGFLFPNFFSKNFLLSNFFFDFSS